MKYSKLDGYQTDAFNIEIMILDEGMTRQEAESVVFWTNLFRAVAVRKCKREGHRMVDASYNGTEEGYVGAECTRCGYFWSKTLY